MKTLILLSLLLISTTTLSQEQDTTYFKMGYGIKYKRTKIHVGKDTLLIRLYEDDKGNQYIKVSERLPQKIKDSIRKVLILRRRKGNLKLLRV